MLGPKKTLNHYRCEQCHMLVGYPECPVTCAIALYPNAAPDTITALRRIDPLHLTESREQDEVNTMTQK